MDPEATKNALELERLTGGWWDETLAVMAAGSEEAEAFTKAARAASQEMEALLKDTTKVTLDLEHAKQAWISATSKVPNLEQITACLWDETLAAIRAGSEEAKAALRKAAGTGNQVEVHVSKDTAKPKPKKRRPKTTTEPHKEPDEHHPNCIDPEKDFYDVCWDIIKEMGLTGVYMKDKMVVSLRPGL
ncbi:hypothetical protein ASPCADRAFT_408489 [Aspergillus carbonarius ITEM 5010]|uniref:Uncharacterized protein n=1 Tax=Aspergillus carbonarius (strain ITEM 5010) TaxID=602072 RepID=A0A1R3RD80_ASPC5|nr:hypothetical protein ASPCADRAFT_408489 [Aspergillus carbonarius ITEM 5010]